MTNEQRAARLSRARFWIRAEFAIAVLAVLIPAFLWIAQAGDIGPMVVPHEPTLGERLVDLMPWVGIVGLGIGFAAMWRLSRLDPERGERTWRYSRVARLRPPRRWVRAEIAVAVFAVLTIGTIWIAQPGTIRGFFKLLLHQSLLPVVGVAGVVVGLGWLLWVAHQDPEAGERTWRHRR
jgi:uncharacterized membrane protein